MFLKRAFDNIKVVDTVYIQRERVSEKDVVFPTKKCNSTHNLPEVRIQTNVENERRPGGRGLVCLVKTEQDVFKKKNTHLKSSVRV